MPQPEDNEPTRDQPSDPDKVITPDRRLAARRFCEFVFRHVNEIRKQPKGCK